MSLLDIENINGITEELLIKNGFELSRIIENLYRKPILNCSQLGGIYYNSNAHTIYVVSDNPYIHPLIMKYGCMRNHTGVEDMSDILVFVNKIHDIILNDKMIKELYDL